MKALVKKKVIEDQAKAERIRVKLQEEQGNRSTERIGPGGRDRRGPINNHNQGLLPFEGQELGGGDANVWGKMPEHGGLDSQVPAAAHPQVCGGRAG